MAREESDSIGTLAVPEEAYYGVQSLRACRNFPITGRAVEKGLIYNIIKIKKAAAIVNGRAGRIDSDRVKAIVAACDEALGGKFDGEFITDCIQGGAGTSMNMNVNEVIANRATELMGGKKGEYICHPNDHVNCSQSTNDVIPTAGKLTVLDLSYPLIAEIKRLVSVLDEKAVQFDSVVKMGRTQLQDAVPIRLGQEFTAYSSAVKRGLRDVEDALEQMHYLNMGGTAIGTAVNVSPLYLHDIDKELSVECGYTLTSAPDLIDATQNVDGFVAVSAALKTLAVTLGKMCNDLRLMGSGPKTGFGEILLPAKQNGSSIMPGKVNPVIPEVVNQVAFAVIGNDMTITMAAEGGQLELNAFEPVIFYKLFESLTTLTGAIKTLTDNCVSGITVNEERCKELLSESVGTVSALCPYIGYKRAAELAKEALLTGSTIRALAIKYGFMSAEQLDKVLDPYEMTKPKA